MRLISVNTFRIKTLILMAVSGVVPLPQCRESVIERRISKAKLFSPGSGPFGTNSWSLQREPYPIAVDGSYA